MRSPTAGPQAERSAECADGDREADDTGRATTATSGAVDRNREVTTVEQESMDLRLFGAVHVDRPGKVAAELREVADGVDALFLEHADEPPGAGTLLRLSVRAPLAAVGLALASFVQLVFLAPLVRDVRPVEQVVARRIAAERDLPVHGVDPLAVTLADWGGRWWVLANWVLFGAFLLAAPAAGLATTVGFVAANAAYVPVYRRSERLGTAAAVVALGGVPAALVAAGLLSLPVVVGGALAFGLLARVTIPVRDAAMAERTTGIAEREGYDSGCLVAGLAHVAGLRGELAERGVSPATVHRSRPLLAGVTAAGDDLDPVEAATGEPDRTARDVLGKRAVAAVVDLVGAAVVAVLAGALPVLLYDQYPDATVGFLVVLAVPLGAFCYFAVPEALGGQTPGKRLVGVVAVNTDGSPLSTRAAVVRNLARPVDAVVGYALGFLVAWLMDGQRLGDIAADSVVVEAP